MQLRINNLSKSFGSKILFEQTGFVLQANDKVTIIGQNGSGKTTLIRCIQGEEDYEGTIETKEKISVMEQEKEFEKQHDTFQKYLDEKFNKVEKQKQEYEVLLGDEMLYEDEERFTKICNEYERLCRQVYHKIEKDKLTNLLQELDFPLEKLEQTIDTLSGGQKTKLRLAEALAKDANMVILDEPTNHLDLKARTYLETYLKQTSKTIIVVSHDRYFLKQIVTKVIEIENKVFQVYNMNYNDYIDKKNKHLIVLKKEHEATTKKKQKLLQSVKQKREWAHQNGNVKLKRLADRLQRDADNLKVTVDVKALRQIYAITFDCEKETGKSVYTLKQATKAYGQKIIFQNADIEIEKRQKIAIIGDNGCGKTTLLKILANLTQLTEGTKEEGHNVKAGYFDQELTNLKTSQKLLDFFLTTFTTMTDHQIAKLALNFGFTNDKFKTRVKTLSGGEKARINLIRLMQEKHNVLLLDEPTNNLDVELMEVLEKALTKYPGTVVFVSHDRQFIDKVATHIIKIENAKVTMSSGNYTANF